VRSFGVDIGGSAIKGCVVDLEVGALVGERQKIETPTPSTPDEVAVVVKEIVGHFEWTGPVGVTFPAIVKEGVILSAANVDQSWIGVHADELFGRSLGLPVVVLNDADAAGLAEMTFGAGKGRTGVVIVLTFGTGVGSALFNDGVLVPNTEFGFLRFRGGPAERYVAARVKKDDNLSWKEWGDRVNDYLGYLNRVFSPNLLILGGGVSRRFGDFASRLSCGAEVIPAEFENQAGIIGAAMAATGLQAPPKKGSVGRGPRRESGAQIGR
jgi:polyphosphate glucokinase